MVRKPETAAIVESAGGQAILGDVLDSARVRKAMEGCGTAIQLAAYYPESPAEAELARRTRVEGTRNLAAAARATGARRLLVGSGYWVYADQGGTLSDDSPLDPRGESLTNWEAELAGLAAHAPGTLEVIVVRPGMVYGDGSWFLGMVGSIRAGTYRIPGDGHNHWSFVELADAAAAYRSILERGVGGGNYLVVDDSPIALIEFVTLVARELGVPLPEPIAYEDLRGEVGDDVAHHLAANRAGTNLKLRSLGWVPKFPDARAGIPALLRSMVQR